MHPEPKSAGMDIGIAPISIQNRLVGAVAAG
jgi:hypothetical protein